MSEFEEHRAHLRAVAYRMLGSLPEADDAVQEAWLRMDRADVSDVRQSARLADHRRRQHLPGHAARPQRPAGTAARRGLEPRLSGTRPSIRSTRNRRRCLPIRSARRCSSSCRRLSPAERLAFVLHDMFDLPFAEIAPIVGRSENTAAQLAARARRRVRGKTPDTDNGSRAPAAARRRVPGRGARRRLRLAARGAGRRRGAAGRRDRRRHRDDDPWGRGGGGQRADLRGQRPFRRARAGGRRGRHRRRARRTAGAGAALRRSSASKITEIDIDADPRRLRRSQFRRPGLTCAHNACVELLTGLGLATAAGLNAYIPLLALGLLSRFTDLITLPHGWAWLENGWVMTIVAVLLVVEIVADKIPALDSVNDAIQTFVRPTAGGIVFGSGTAAQTSAVTDPGAFAQSGQWIPIVDRCRRRARGVADEVGGAARRQRRHRRRGRTGAVHHRGRNQRRPGLPGDPDPGAGARCARGTGVGVRQTAASTPRRRPRPQDAARSRRPCRRRPRRPR